MSGLTRSVMLPTPLKGVYPGSSPLKPAAQRRVGQAGKSLGSSLRVRQEPEEVASSTIQGLMKCWAWHLISEPHVSMMPASFL